MDNEFCPFSKKVLFIDRLMNFNYVYHNYEIGHQLTHFYNSTLLYSHYVHWLLIVVFS